MQRLKFQAWLCFELWSEEVRAFKAMVADDSEPDRKRSHLDDNEPVKRTNRTSDGLGFVIVNIFFGVVPLLKTRFSQLHHYNCLDSYFNRRHQS